MPAKIRCHLNQLEKMQSFPGYVLTRPSPVSTCRVFLVSLSRHQRRNNIDNYEEFMIAVGITLLRIRCDLFGPLSYPRCCLNRRRLLCLSVSTETSP
eukprot:5496017-Pyramimonas_sp.AAC.1